MALGTSAVRGAAGHELAAVRAVARRVLHHHAEGFGEPALAALGKLRDDPDAVDVEPTRELGGVDRGDDVAQDLQENLEDGALGESPVPDAVEPPD